MNRYRLYFLPAFCLFALTPLKAQSPAATVPAPALRAASVDMERVLQTCRQTKLLEAAARREISSMGDQIKAAAEAQQKRSAYYFNELSRKLETSSGEERRQTDEEATALREELTASAKDLQKLQSEYQTRSRELVAAAHQQLRQLAQQVGQQAAKEKGIHLLVNTGVGADILFCDPAALPDLTEEIITRLNKAPDVVLQPVKPATPPVKPTSAPKTQ